MARVTAEAAGVQPAPKPRWRRLPRARDLAPRLSTSATGAFLILIAQVVAEAPPDLRLVGAAIGAVVAYRVGYIWGRADLADELLEDRRVRRDERPS